MKRSFSLVVLLVFVLVALVASACGSGGASSDDPSMSNHGAGDETAPLVEREPEREPESEPLDREPVEPEPMEATATPSPCAAPGAPPPAPPTPFDPTTLDSYVSGRQAPQGAGRGRVESIRVAPNARVPTVSELSFCVVVDGRAQRFNAIVPHAFPVPFDEGQEIVYRGGSSGGGPNHRATMSIRDPDGSLLLSIDTTVAEVAVEEGRRVRREPGNEYHDDVHAAVFTPSGGAPTTVAPGAWAEIGPPDARFVVWASAHRRTLRPHHAPPPDYVASWLDFTIVRLR